MARKPNPYLASLLHDDDEPSEIQSRSERVRPSALLRRETALARVQSGEVKQVTQLHLDPKRVRIWPGNARIYAQLTEERCSDLIDSLIAENGQKVPAIVRRVTDDPTYDYEVIAGTRRHWSISWLRQHSYPDMQFVAQVMTLDDEAAFRLADIENRARQDISDIERARNYAQAVKQYYEGKQKRMAERLRVSEGWLSKMLQVARIPDNILQAFSSLETIQLKPAYALARELDDTHALKRVTAKARVIAREQQELYARGELPIPSSDVLRRLMDAATSPSQKTLVAPIVIQSRLGRPALSVQSTNRQGVTIRLHAGSGATNEELLQALNKALSELDATGRGIHR
ncbi:ParB/RepB/Spo0J family partition protein [Swingsia samuiensis]|uniref:ParB/RepB/Spo0J family partition protein n=1 Tax=Swingsia samuiensis TaxID=1293412 RepID=A0A4Y6UM46_9PROT|nr:ParB/RepB/Spo0J family partition protein [Swingsia samuiensis]QDH18114.1 ParB/RepB/Spo0J family partition protein [Swingsia samuiensis]